MGILHGIWLLVLGGLGAASLVARRPEGRKALAALEPYQGWIGAASVVVGVWHLVTALLGAGLIRWWALGWLLRVADGLLLVAAGPGARRGRAADVLQERHGAGPAGRRGPGHSSPTGSASASPPWCLAPTCVLRAIA